MIFKSFIGFLTLCLFFLVLFLTAGNDGQLDESQPIEKMSHLTRASSGLIYFLFSLCALVCVCETTAVV